jgi:hypothetical protein
MPYGRNHKKEATKMATREVADGAEPLIIPEGKEAPKKVKPKKKPLEGSSPSARKDGIGILPNTLNVAGNEDDPPISKD